MPFKKNKSNNKSKRFGDSEKFIMLQFGKTFLDETDTSYKTRVSVSRENDAYNWCVREKVDGTYEVIYWFGYKKGMELLVRAIAAGKYLTTSAFFEGRNHDGMEGNCRIDIKGVATDKELAAAKQAAANEAWEDAEDDDESEEEEEEEPTPAPKAKAKAKQKNTYKRPIEEAEEEQTDDYEDDLPY
jgi:hypothetical protein